ncbi:hypothetical protein EV175_002078 [Coemansia sp. RSA 1933]|nr:hypothetical protein EV175_002078 [Coemansia sp. RSA 1933]
MARRRYASVAAGGTISHAEAQERLARTSDEDTAEVDHLVIGAGVVGLAVGRQLSQRTGTSTIVVEKNERLGMETSSRNSEVIHAGIYYPQESLRTKLCIEGKQAMYEYCARRNVPHQKVGKWVVAQSEAQAEYLHGLEAHCLSVGVPAEIIDGSQASRIEPHVRARRALVSPTTGIVDSHALMAAMHGDLLDNGADLATGSQVVAISTEGGRGYRVLVATGDPGEPFMALRAGVVVNAAGLWADRIAGLLVSASHPWREKYRLHFAKGRYYMYTPHASAVRVSRLIYPVPDKDITSLGTHLTIDMGGAIRFGPDLQWVDSNADYAPADDPALLAGAARSIAQFLPAIGAADLSPGYTGIRPKLQGQGGAFRDFVIKEESADGFPGFVNLIGIESPGLTASLAIAAMVGRLSAAMGVEDERDTAARATVLYYCPCSNAMRAQVPAGEDEEKEPRLKKKKSADSSDSESDMADEEEGDGESRTALPLDPSSTTHIDRLLPLRASPIESLYYCDDCSELRCTRCVIEEPAGYHCPNCLFDVPTASVRGEKNCCVRNCFQCPACTHVLSVAEGDRRQNDSGCFVLACSVCLWNSAEIGWTFEKATGISAQIERVKEAKTSHKEFANLLDHWRTVQRTSGAAASSSSTMPHSRGPGKTAVSAAFKHRMGTSSSYVMNSLRRAASAAEDAAEVSTYTATSGAKGDGSAHLGQLMSLSNADNVPYQSVPLVNEPQRVRLHMKVARRCRQCHHILIKPESKAQATRFKIQLMAANFLPTITVPTALSLQKALVGGRHSTRQQPVGLPRGPFTAGETVSMALRFANPLYTEMAVAVDAPSSPDYAHIEVVSPSFTLPPFTELWEYDDDDDNDSDDADSSATTRGILDRQGNRVAIQINVMPLADAAVLTVPLRVSCSHVDDMDVDADGSNSAAQRRAIKNSFWIYIHLGA